MISGRDVRAKLTRPGVGWAMGTLFLAMAVAVAPAAEIFCHEEHGVEEHCADCLLPHPPATERCDAPPIELADVAEPIEPVREVVRSSSRRYLRQPARAPPAWL